VDIRFISSFSIITSRTEADRRLIVGTLGLPLHPPEGAPAGADGYVFTEALDGAKHFGLWPLSEAAEACFGTASWPDTHPVPQASIEFEVDDVAAAAEELEAAGYTLLHPPRIEPWGQGIARLQTDDGLIVGVSYTPWMRLAD
jgi:catechol 2,3-dioxygenase-like lactoylglutathione lyase family enzyme